MIKLQEFSFWLNISSFSPMLWQLPDSVTVVITRFCDSVNLEFYKLQKFWFGLRLCLVYIYIYNFFVESEFLFSLLKGFEGIGSG